jgi:hypothetical protein
MTLFVTAKNASYPLLSVILSERSESKDLLFGLWRMGGKPQTSTPPNL